jgi:hypothetical protein
VELRDRLIGPISSVSDDGESVTVDFGALVRRRISIFETKLEFIASTLDPDVQERRFERVIKLFDLPDVDPNPTVHGVDLPRLLEVLDSDEARKFRGWLRGIDTQEDQELKDQMRRLRDLLGDVMRSPTGRIARFAAVTGLGFVPGVGVFASAGAGVLDSFLLQELLQEPGPTAFLSRLYPSIFDTGQLPGAPSKS